MENIHHQVKENIKKKRNLSVARNKKKRDDNKAKEMEFQKWLELYECLLTSDKNWDKYCTTPVSVGAQGRVDLHRE